MGAFEDFLGGAARALELLREAYRLTLQASEAYGHARSHLATAVEGSSSPELSASQARLAAVEVALNEAAGYAVDGAEDFKAYLVLIGAGSAVESGAWSPSAREARTEVVAEMEPLRHNRFRPEGMEGIRPYGEVGTAEGNLFFDGGKHNTKPIKATPGGSPFRPGEVRSGWERKTPADGGHVEGIAAAAMLHHGKTEASLYLNAEPCDKAGEGCKENAAHFIKPDSVMWIHVQHENGTRFRKRITGTGRALHDDDS